MADVEFLLKMIRPIDPRDIGREAIAIATSILRFSDGPDVGRITTPVTDGFSVNFDWERGGQFWQEWRPLAERTQRERKKLGFPAQHPILHRTGSYRRSWTQRTASTHFERQARFGMWTGRDFMGSQNRVWIGVGSQDYRVPTLEGGLGRPAALVERESTLNPIPGQVFGQPGFSSGNVPARPVAWIEDSFARRIGQAVEWLLGEKLWGLGKDFQTK